MGTPPATAGKLAFAHTQTPESVRRTLTFAERVAYQYAIEEIYWRHRIWPKDNPEPKPTLDAVMSRAQVERKVNNYLRMSQLLAEQWQRPITPEQLQAEMDRMTSDTKKPDVLRELFAALGNDPFIIAECLARPILTQRLLADRKGGSSGTLLDAKFNPNAIGDSSPSTHDLIASEATGLPALQARRATYTLPKILYDCADDSWTATPNASAPDPRRDHSAIWTGSELIVWGGYNITGGQLHTLNTGARYDPAIDTWTGTSTTNAPLGRNLHRAVWTGNAMMVWGGENYPVGVLNDGGRYNPATDTWLPVSTANAPVPREQHSAIWTGREMIVWGGRDWTTWFNSGGRYNPDTDNWATTSTANAPERRWYHTAEWTGREMIVWGGTNQTIALNTGGKYNPATDSWAATSAANAPVGRFAHTSIWSGSEMDVWGGLDSTLNDYDTGGRYNPTADSWTAISTLNAPSARDSHSAVWTGSEMLIWGGVCCNPGVDYNTGGRYNPGTDSWTATGTANVPHARDSHSAVWTGDKMMIWGGGYYAGSNFILLNTGGIYCAQPSTPIVQSAVSRKTHGNAGNFDVDLPLSGTPAIECRSGDATSDYTIVVTFLANVSVNASPQAAVTSGIGIIGSGGASNGGVVITSGNVVTIPLTNVANAQTINITLSNVNGSTNVTIPMRVLIGGVNGNGTVNASDVALTKSRIGQPVDQTIFRSDVNANGSINATDVSLVKSSIGTGLP